MLGAGKSSATLLVNPWLAYGCSVGSRVRTESGFATVSAIKDDDTCEILRDNVKEGTRGEKLAAGEVACEARRAGEAGRQRGASEG